MQLLRTRKGTHNPKRAAHIHVEQPETSTEVYHNEYSDEVSDPEK